MNDLTRVSIEAVVTLRQMIDTMLDSEINRLVNGLYPSPDMERKLLDTVEGSAYIELVRGLFVE